MQIPGFQSAVAHELISNAYRDNLEAFAVEGFKALSRMSSFPTDYVFLLVQSKDGFKALSRMSSFPTHHRVARVRATLFLFQSAVAHELISNPRPPWSRPLESRFKALSRMSSFPTATSLARELGAQIVSKRCRA